MLHILWSMKPQQIGTAGTRNLCSRRFVGSISSDIFVGLLDSQGYPLVSSRPLRSNSQSDNNDPALAVTGSTSEKKLEHPWRLKPRAMTGGVTQSRVNGEVPVDQGLPQLISCWYWWVFKIFLTFSGRFTLKNTPSGAKTLESCVASLCFHKDVYYPARNFCTAASWFFVAWMWLT